MICRSDFHMHSRFSDGACSQEEMVLSAIGKGFETIGFSEHSYAACDLECCMKKEAYESCRREIAALKEKYAGRMEIYCGIEQEYFSEEPTEGFDYVIGAAHYIKCGEDYYSVDYLPENITEAAEKHFGGDTMRVAEEYYRIEADVYRKTRCDIIAHFDLVTKLNERFGFFDTDSARYKKAWKEAAASILEDCRLFEINTGAISRGWRTSPYPSLEICRFIAANGGSFILSSDSHSAANIGYAFEKVRSEYENAGIKIVEFNPEKRGV